MHDDVIANLESFAQHRAVLMHIKLRQPFELVPATLGVITKQADSTAVRKGNVR